MAPCSLRSTRHLGLTKTPSFGSRATVAAMLALFAVATTSLLLPRAPAPRMEVKTPSPAVTGNRKVLIPVFPEACEYTGITLTRYMNEVARANPELLDLETLISSISTACKTIKMLVERSHLTGLVGYADGGGSINVQGEEQKTLDVITNDVLKKALRFTGKMGVIASEEEDIPVEVGDSSGLPVYDTTALMDETGRCAAAATAATAAAAAPAAAAAAVPAAPAAPVAPATAAAAATAATAATGAARPSDRQTAWPPHRLTT